MERAAVSIGGLVSIAGEDGSGLSGSDGGSIDIGSDSGEASCSSGPALLLGDTVEAAVDAACASENAPSVVDVVDIGGVGSVAAALEGDMNKIWALGGAGCIASKSCGQVTVSYVQYGKVC